MTPQKKLIIILIAIGAAVRILFLLSSNTVHVLDSWIYIKIATQIWQLDFKDYVGEKPPVYPLFIILTDFNYYFTWIIQAIMGIITSIILFNLTFYQTKSHIFAFLVGLGNSINLVQLYFESAILSETLTTFLLVLSLFLIYKILLSSKIINIYFVLLGFLSIVLVFLRLVFFQLPIIYLAFFIYYLRRLRVGGVSRFFPLLSFLAPVLVVLFCLCIFHKITLGHCTPTVYTGIHLTNKIGGFIELAPDDYNIIKETYLKYRAKRIEDTGSYADTIYYALPELIKLTGISHIKLSLTLRKMSLYLIIHHPWLYLKSVIYSWVNYWLVCIKSPETKYNLINNNIANLLKGEVFILGFFIYSFLFVAFISFTRYNPWSNVVALFNNLVIIIILSASVCAALFEYGNCRYLVPFHGLIIYLVVSFAVNFYYKILAPPNHPVKDRVL